MREISEVKGRPKTTRSCSRSSRAARCADAQSRIIWKVCSNGWRSRETEMIWHAACLASCQPDEKSKSQIFIKLETAGNRRCLYRVRKSERVHWVLPKSIKTTFQYASDSKSLQSCTLQLQSSRGDVILYVPYLLPTGWNSRLTPVLHIVPGSCFWIHGLNSIAIWACDVHLERWLFLRFIGWFIISWISCLSRQRGMCLMSQ